MNLAEFQAQFNPALSVFLTEAFTNVRSRSQDPTLAHYFAAAERLADGGKRIRPYLAHAAYTGTVHKSGDDILRIGIALECFQLFCLLQDDVIDRSLMRHGQPTLHQSIHSLLSNERRHGELEHIANGLAVLLGDLYFSWANSLISAELPGLSPTAHRLVIARYSAMVHDVLVGQMLDVDFTTRPTVTQQAVQEKMRLKTSAYSIVAPLSLGFHAAEAGGAAQAWALLFGNALGEAFQLQDDLLDIYQRSTTTGKTALNDLREGQQTFLTVYVQTHGNDLQRTELATMLGNANFSDAERAQQLFKEVGAKAACEEKIAAAYRDAHALLIQAPLQTPVRDRLTELVTTLEKRDR